MRQFLVKLTLVGVLLSLYLVIVQKKPIGQPHPTPAQVQGVSETKTIDTKNVPEMAEIMAQDQETRLKGSRKLAERVGVMEALEILEHSALPHTGEGHLVVHQIGFYAYQKHGAEGILKCKDYFLFACYHGVIIEAATDQGTQGISKMTDTCKGSSTRFFQCTHAAGHAILAMYTYDLPQALKVCDELYEKETAFPETLSSCHNGAFMENLFGVHDWGTTNSPKNDWIKDDDPYFPCNAFGGKYQKGCWLNQAARIYQMYQGDIQKTAAACEELGNLTYKDWCFDNLARQLHPLAENNLDRVFELCNQLGDFRKEGCVIVNAGAYYSVGGRIEGITICSRLAGPAQNYCHERILGQIIGDTLSLPEKSELCNKLPTPYRETCINQLKTTT